MLMIMVFDLINQRKSSLDSDENSLVSSLCINNSLQRFEMFLGQVNCAEG